jgi:hypothetical protein
MKYYLLDREEIRERLGLLTPAEVRIRHNCQPGDRRSGRTTEMILEILVACQTKDSVFIDSVSKRHSDYIVIEARKAASQLDRMMLHTLFRFDKIKAFISLDRLRGQDPSSYQIFQDHTIHDRLIERLSRSQERRIPNFLDALPTWGNLDEEYQLAVDLGSEADRQAYTVFVSENKPTVCEGCINYNGSSYGGNLLICGMHPYGCKSNICPDWEA